MRNRCLCVTTPDYRYYGGRGITICPEWDDFWVFVEDLGDRPLGYTLDRIDVNGNYEPSNCRWASRATQAINQRPQVLGNRWTQHHDPMRYITVRPSGNFLVGKSVNGKRIYKTFTSLEAAKDFRSDLEMECELNRMLYK